MRKSFYVLALAFTFFAACKEENTNLSDGLYAEIETEKGTIITTLEFEKSPVTTANFILLAEGKNPYVNEKYKGKPFFDGLTFHRVESSFMIQGGDPDGNGSGGPGYRFKDEYSDLKFDKSGVLAMANAGPGTNGSQFFITHVPTDFLDGKHSIFGHVIENGMETVKSIERGDVINSIKIIRKGEAAKKFDALKMFTDYVARDQEDQKKRAAIQAENKRIYEEKFKEIKAKKMEEHIALKSTSKKTKTGLQFKIVKKGSGKKPKNGTQVYINYAGYLEDGSLFDSNVASVAKENGAFDPQREMAGVYSPIPFEAGKKEGMIPGFIEGIEQLSFGDKAIIFIPSHLGYGPQGTRNIIPPNANLIFEIELLEKPN
jgi:cyclophilin family peptidyl-prolyl cis-trans isomerase